MKLLIINGSPRAKSSNTGVLLSAFLDGFNPGEGDEVNTVYLKICKDMPGIAASLASYDAVILGFPLYTDAMPGIVKEFIEELIPYKGKLSHVKLGFLVQSGFPEARHCSYIIKYLEALSTKLEAQYIGTMTRGNIEGIQVMPESWTRKIISGFNGLGKAFRDYPAAFDKQLLIKLKSPWKMSRSRRTFFRIASIFGLTDMYWNGQLKKNKAYENRFQQPHA